MTQPPMKRFAQLLAMFLLCAYICSIAYAATETTTYFHNDISGTPMMATNGGGDVIWKEAYLAYGIKLTNSPNAADNKIGYAGKPYDNNTKLSYMGARYYSPDLGRFLAVDPVGYDPENIYSFNRYVYANNNPYKYVDPDGHSPIDVAFLVYDLGKLGVAVYTGVGIGAAAVDVGFSIVGALSPIPTAGQVLKAERISKSVEITNVVDKAADVGGTQKTYQTYLKTNPKTGVVYSGRCSGCGTPIENIAKRDSKHHMNDQGYGRAVLDKSSANPAAIRGREQENIERFGGAKSQGGSSGNAINGIGDGNPKKEFYMKENWREFSK